MTACEKVHRLLFHALLEIRAESLTGESKVAYRLADLFHNVVLRMENAAQSGADAAFEDVLEDLRSRAAEQNCGRWLEAGLKQITEQESRDQVAVSQNRDD